MASSGVVFGAEDVGPLLFRCAAEMAPHEVIATATALQDGLNAATLMDPKMDPRCLRVEDVPARLASGRIPVESLTGKGVLQVADSLLLLEASWQGGNSYQQTVSTSAYAHPAVLDALARLAGYAGYSGARDLGAGTDVFPSAALALNKSYMAAHGCDPTGAPLASAAAAPAAAVDPLAPVTPVASATQAPAPLAAALYALAVGTLRCCYHATAAISRADVHHDDDFCSSMTAPGVEVAAGVSDGHVLEALLRAEAVLLRLQAAGGADGAAASLVWAAPDARSATVAPAAALPARVIDADANGSSSSDASAPPMPAGYSWRALTLASSGTSVEGLALPPLPASAAGAVAAVVPVVVDALLARLRYRRAYLCAQMALSPQYAQPAPAPFKWGHRYRLADAQAALQAARGHLDAVKASSPLAPAAADADAAAAVGEFDGTAWPVAASGAAGASNSASGARIAGLLPELSSLHFNGPLPRAVPLPSLQQGVDALSVHIANAHVACSLPALASHNPHRAWEPSDGASAAGAAASVTRAPALTAASPDVFPAQLAEIAVATGHTAGINTSTTGIVSAGAAAAGAASAGGAAAVAASAGGDDDDALAAMMAGASVSSKASGKGGKGKGKGDKKDAAASAPPPAANASAGPAAAPTAAAAAAPAVALAPPQPATVSIAALRTAARGLKPVSVGHAPSTDLPPVVPHSGVVDAPLVWPVPSPAQLTQREAEFVAAAETAAAAASAAAATAASLSLPSPTPTIGSPPPYAGACFAGESLLPLALDTTSTLTKSPRAHVSLYALARALEDYTKRNADIVARSWLLNICIEAPPQATQHSHPRAEAVRAAASSAAASAAGDDASAAQDAYYDYGTAHVRSAVVFGTHTLLELVRASLLEVGVQPEMLASVEGRKLCFLLEKPFTDLVRFMCFTRTRFKQRSPDVLRDWAVVVMEAEQTDSMYRMYLDMRCDEAAAAYRMAHGAEPFPGFAAEYCGGIWPPPSGAGAAAADATSAEVLAAFASLPVLSAEEHAHLHVLRAASEQCCHLTDWALEWATRLMALTLHIAQETELIHADEQCAVHWYLDNLLNTQLRVTRHLHATRALVARYDDLRRVTRETAIKAAAIPVVRTATTTTTAAAAPSDASAAAAVAIVALGSPQSLARPSPVALEFLHAQSKKDSAAAADAEAAIDADGGADVVSAASLAAKKKKAADKAAASSGAKGKGDKAIEKAAAAAAKKLAEHSQALSERLQELEAKNVAEVADYVNFLQVHVRSTTAPFDVAQDSMAAQQHHCRALVRVLILARATGLWYGLPPGPDDTPEAETAVRDAFMSGRGSDSPVPDAGASADAASKTPLPAAFAPPADLGSSSGSAPLFRRSGLVYSNRFRDFLAFSSPRYSPFSTYCSSTRFDSPDAARFLQIASHASSFVQGCVEFSRRALGRIRSFLAGAPADLLLDAAPYSTAAQATCNAALATPAHGAKKGGKTAASASGPAAEVRSRETKRLEMFHAMTGGSSVFYGHDHVMPLQAALPATTAAVLTASSDMAALARLQRASTGLEALAKAVSEPALVARLNAAVSKGASQLPMVPAIQRVRFDRSVDPAFPVASLPPAPVAAAAGAAASVAASSSR